MKSKSNIDCTALCCIPQTMALVFLVKNLRVVALITLSTASLVLAPSAEIGGSLIDCCGEPKPFFLFCFLVFENFVCCDFYLVI